MSSLRFLVVAALGAIALPAHAAGDATAGSKKNFQCEGCHGIVDWKTVFPELYHVPKLGGQKSAYIVSALKAYKAGQRDHPTMRAIAADLSDQDMEDLAAYYGQSAPSGMAERK